ELLENYAWYVRNSHDRARPVGGKKPNDFGLFDMYGNAWEWCHDAVSRHPIDAGKRVVEDRETGLVITASDSRILRGVAFTSPAPQTRSACRFAYPPNVPFVLAGLRVAKTWP